LLFYLKGAGPDIALVEIVNLVAMPLNAQKLLAQPGLFTLINLIRELGA
jgi:hypothetical protein